MAKESKTVYVLGAGASKSMGVPLQSNILETVFNTEWTDDLATSFLDINSDEMAQCFRNAYGMFCDDRQILCKFLIETFFPLTMQEENLQSLDIALLYVRGTVEYHARMEMVYKAILSQNITLEDLFTIFDRTASENSHFHGYNPKSMREIHQRLRRCVIYALAYSCKYKLNTSNAIHDFAQYLVNKRLSQRHKVDCFSVITLNWDTLLEKEIYKQCQDYNRSSSRKKAFPDLCFYDYSYPDNANHQVSTHVKSNGNWNIKLLKMHGSLAWLECPECGRVFTDYESDVAIHEYDNVICRYCKGKSVHADGDPMLRSMIVTPTYIKELGNLHFKNIWHNAFIDLSEATDVVFVGYSFPNADFEMRCLLKKAIQPSTSITVVLAHNDDPKPYLDDFISKGYTLKRATCLVDKLSLPQQRYAAFFGGERDIKFLYNELEGYVEAASHV